MTLNELRTQAMELKYKHTVIMGDFNFPEINWDSWSVNKSETHPSFQFIKMKLMRSLVISIFLYACESWTLTAELEKRTQAFEMRCYRRLLNISYKDHVTNDVVRRKIQAAIGEYDELLTLVKKRKLRWFDHVSRSSGLAKTILQCTVKGKRKGGRQKKRWEDNIKEWTGMDFASSTRAAETGL